MKEEADLISIQTTRRLDIYGREQDESIGHVFHVNILTPEAIRCNNNQCAFFRELM